MRPRLRRAAAVLLLVGSALVLAPAPAGAATLEQSAWWYRATTSTPAGETPLPGSGVNPTVPVTAPRPPTVGADQLHVEGAPSGAVAVAALTYRLGEGESSPVLTLTPAAGSSLPPSSVILACRVAIDWTAPATSPGAWEAKPLADCSTSVQGQILDATAGGGVVFPLQPLVVGNELDVIIVPGTNPSLPAGTNGSVFSLTFARPGPEALRTTSATGGSDFTPSVTFDEDFAFEPPATDPDTFAAPVPTPTFDSTVVIPVAPVVAPALEPQDQAPLLPRPLAPAAVTTEDAGGAARKLGLLLLALGAVAAFMSSADTPGDVMGLGRYRRPRPLAARDAVAEEAGVGRLRRLRTGPPPAL